MPVAAVRPHSFDMTLQEVIRALAGESVVLSAAVIGSRALEAQDGSDIDLLVTVDGPIPRLWLSPSYIESTPADILTLTDGTLSEFAGDPGNVPQAISHWLHAVLPSATVTHDRSGHLRAAILTAQAQKPTPTDPHYAWCALNVQAIVIRRLRRSPRRERELAVTLAGSFEVLWQAYFTCRRLPDMSQKERLTWLDEHDPDLYSRFTEAWDLPVPERADAWLALARHAAVPIGGLWPDGHVIEPDGDPAWADDSPPSLGQLLRALRPSTADRP